MLSQLSEAFRSQIAKITADFTHRFVMYQSDDSSSVSYFSSYDNATSLRGIVEEHQLNDNYTITWSEGRMPKLMRQVLPTIRHNTPIFTQTISDVCYVCVAL
jgi:hypothetical protein